MTGYIKFFDLDNDLDFHEYLSIWRSGTSRRPHDHPQYMRLMRIDKQKPCALVYFEDFQPKILYAVYLTDVFGDEPIGPLEANNKHMVSAYGYGGPVLVSDTGADVQQFEKLLDDYIVENRIISEFVREDLFSGFKVPRKFLSIKQQDNVVINLKKTHEELWGCYKQSVRKNIKRAKSSCLEVLLDFNGSLTGEFVRVYHLTMIRTGAKQSFMIPLEEFEKLNEYFSEDKIGFYAHVVLEGKVVATELILRSPSNIYSFLGGSDMNYSNLRPSDLLKHEVNMWAIDNDIGGYVLGGGVKPYDGIYMFKLAFDQEGAHPFSIQKNIHDNDAYNDMVVARKRSEQQHGNSWEPNPDFFPSYFS